MRNRNWAIRLPRIKLISAAVAACFASHLAFANPTGPTVVNGQVTFHQQGNLLQITNSPSSIINWQSFSIGTNEITRFLQQSSSSAVLNRVTTQNPSSILGALQSNGRVLLINPNGIMFGAGAQIDVAGLVASTLRLSDTDFLAGRLRFTDGVGAGSVINQGTISAPTGGHVYLVGPAVTNGGVITSPKGEVILAAGNSVELVNPGTPNLRVEITAPDNQAINLGQIVAESGRVGIYAGLIYQSGTIRADSAVVTEDGRIVLKATKGVTLEASSVTAASGARGGEIIVQSGDTTLVAGAIEAKGSEDAGGTVQVLGNLVGLVDNASVSASGVVGGGTVLVGGDFQGKNPEIQNASSTYFGPNATIGADANGNGDGGKVVVWSNDATRAYGTITAQGGAQSGDGGFVEVSGKNYLDFAARVDTTAASGATGTLLLDPTTTTISAAPTSGGSCPPAGPCFVLVGNPDTATLNVGELVTTLGSTNVTVSTTSGGNGDGDINVATPVFYTSANALTLDADRNINAIGNSIFNSGTGAISLGAGGDINVQDANIISLGGPIMANGRNVNVTGMTVPTSIQAHTLAINVVEGLRVHAGAIAGAHASVSSGHGQTINAGFIEVIAQENTANILNSLSGNQVITTIGANASGEGVVVRSSGGADAFARISQSGAGEQVINVSNAGQFNVNGIGGFALIGATAQTISVTGATSANVINLGSPGAMGSSQLFGGTQNITAGLAGEASSIAIHGSDAANRQAIIVSGQGAGSQTVSTSGELVVTGGSPVAGGLPSGMFANGNGGQYVSAAGIALQGGSSGAGNSATITSFFGPQQVEVGGGGISLTGGTGGTNNGAVLRQALPGGSQTITAIGDIALQGGSGGTNNQATLTGAVQTITTTGDVRLSGSSGSGSGVRLGGPGGATPGATNLVLSAGGDVLLTSGSASGTAAVIGNPNSGMAQPTHIAISAGGSVILNAGSLSGARVGQAEVVPGAGGDISINAGGDIRLNGTAQPSRIRTQGNVELHADSPGGTISANSNGFVHANQLTTTSDSSTSLTGPNQVAALNASSITGDVAFNNTSPLLTVTGINQSPLGALTINQTGDLTLTGMISSGPQSITATGNISVVPSSSVLVRASGDVLFSATGGITVDDSWIVADGSVTMNGASLDVRGMSAGALIQAGEAFNANVTGDLRVRSASAGGSIGGWAAIVAEGANSNAPADEPNASSHVLGVGLLDRIAGHGPVNLSAGNVTLEGGGNIGGFAMITGGPVSATTTGNFSIAGGSGFGAFGWVLSSQNINLTVGGNLMLNSGTGPLSFARMQTVQPTSVINVSFPNLSSGGYFVNGIEGAYRDGLTGFFAGPTAAKPGKRLITTYGE